MKAAILIRVGAALAVAVLAAAPAWAHHAFAAEFDIGKPLKLQGVVTEMEWINPHAWIHLDVKGPDGKVTSWMVEGGSPNILLRRGFTKKSLEKGTEVVVEGYQAKNGENRANGANITFKDGKRLFLGGSSPEELPQAAK
ncbi:MAG TPA: DUF6152 family protein [Bryobacteraceae bacterium]|jgi:hypothetical protein